LIWLDLRAIDNDGNYINEKDRLYSNEVEGVEQWRKINIKKTKEESLGAETTGILKAMQLQLNKNSIDCWMQTLACQELHTRGRKQQQ